MALPKRQVAVAVRRGSRTLYKWANTLKEALVMWNFKEGDKFSYRTYEGGNAVECEYKGGGKFRERRK